MNVEWETLPGIVVRGHRVASQPSRDYPYPTLGKQKPIFKQLGLDLDHYFLGTLNISIAPLEFEMIKPAFTFQHVEWTDLHPPETFSFVSCRIIFCGREYSGMIYYPHPETKIRHFQDRSLLEIMAEKIPGIKYGDCVTLKVDPSQIKINK